MQVMKGELAIRMMAGACLCNLVSAWLSEQAKAGTARSHAYLDMMSGQGFQILVQCLEASIQVRSSICLCAGGNSTQAIVDCLETLLSSCHVLPAVSSLAGDGSK